MIFEIYTTSMTYGSVSFKVKHNIDTYFIKEDGTIYTDPCVIYVEDVDQPIEYFLVKKKHIINNTIYVPIERAEWLLQMNDVKDSNTGETYVKFNGTRSDATEYNSGFLYETDMSTGHIKYNLEIISAFAAHSFLNLNKGGLRIYKTN